MESSGASFSISRSICRTISFAILVFLVLSPCGWFPEMDNLAEATTLIRASVTTYAASGHAGQPVTLKANVHRDGGNTGNVTPIQGKTLTFKITGVGTVGTGTSNSAGDATLSYTIPANWPSGTKTIMVVCPSGGGYIGSMSSNALTVTSP
jgi:hypothetical protein